MTDPAYAATPAEPSHGEALGPEPADWAGIARLLREFTAIAAQFFALPKNDKAALIVIVFWWPIIGSILFIVYITIGAYLFGLAVATVGMSRPLPRRKPVTDSLIVCSCIAAGAAILLPILTVAELDSPIVIAFASLSVGLASVTCIMLFRRHLQNSDRWQPRRPRPSAGDERNARRSG